MGKNIAVQPGEKKSRAYFIENMKPGNVVAFTAGERMLSGRVKKINGNTVTIRTKNGSIFYVEKQNVVWVLTGSHWPVGIYNALRYGKEGEK